MWLLDTHTLTLREFTGEATEPYAILSHTWEKDEISFRLLQDEPLLARQKLGWAKVEASCEQARASSFRYIWIDTCCIDKSSSAELSEAINSMYRWYREAKVCYAYLADVPDDVDVYWKGSHFHRSKWFQRGWTLQELLAPTVVYFFSRGWKPLGSKTKLRQEVSDITKIDEATLCGQVSLFNTSVMRRFRWASGRMTTRTEDMAYCLLGIFNVNMPLLYGEGKKAFVRLQEEIIKKSNDLTILAWNSRQLDPEDQFSGAYWFLAQYPSVFREAQDAIDYIPDELTKTKRSFYMTNLGLRVSAYVIKPKNRGSEREELLVLPCRELNHVHNLLGISCERVSNDRLVRYRQGPPISIDRHLIANISPSTFYLVTGLEVSGLSTLGGPWGSLPTPVGYNVIIRTLPNGVDIKPADVMPAGAYDPETRILKVYQGTAVHIRNSFVVFYGQEKAAVLTASSDDAVEYIRDWCSSPRTANDFEALARPSFSQLFTSLEFTVEITKPGEVIRIGSLRHVVSMVDIYKSPQTNWKE